ncbi:glycoside hydrolase family 68 protein [Fructobacillus sp. W13]|uniref:Glycoside hydrolase family 68 protein n=1 Tax=Fructobacillus apis TaxID=2935017 RepID=A0ABT0ZNY5_9LACO|nr:glycoside hydrolase family 68 protein [Fructobacillus apis]MCO0831677.1 glycoside hydrolase family 68 protein [Fructobacillus apis]
MQSFNRTKQSKKKTIFKISGIVLIVLIVVSGLYGWKHRRGIRIMLNQVGVTSLTRQDMDDIEKKVKGSKDYRIPDYKEDSLLTNVPSSKAYNEKTGKWETVYVWDSWPVTMPDGTVANYHGYRLTMGLTKAGGRADAAGAKIGLYAQKISDDSTDVSSWQYLGNVFATYGEGRDKSKSDKWLDDIQSEWSGTTTLMKSSDSTLRVFYTNAMLRGNQGQALTTAQVSVEPKDGSDWDSGLTINHEKAKDHKTVFVGDGKIYQSVDQAVMKGKAGDSFAMRDPHFVTDGDKWYLTFEGNTGTDYGYQGENNFKHAKYFGSNAFLKKEVTRLKKKENENEYNWSYLANSALGKLELNKDFTVKKIMKPMVTGNATIDETERPNLFEYKGKWYLFTCFWGDKFAQSNPYLKGKTYMFGYVSDNGINGTYKPLNGNGLVLQSNTPGPDPRIAYAWLVVKPSKIVDDRFVVTSFQESRTFSPSFILEIKGNKTKMITDRVLDQGALETTGKTYSAKSASA